SPSLVAAALFLSPLLVHDLSAQSQFQPGRSYVLPSISSQLYWACSGDVDGDGDTDLVYGCDHGKNLLLLNDGKGSFVDGTAGRLTTPTANATYRVTLADLDADGDLDLVVANDHFLANRLYLNNGKGVFTDVSTTNLPTNADYTISQAVFDYDGDGDLDIYYGNSGRDKLYVNNGKAVFTDATATQLPMSSLYPTYVEAGDLDADGDIDLVLSNGTTVQFLRNQKPGGFSIWAPTGAPAQAGGRPTAADFDGDGRTDLFFGSSMKLFLQTSTGFRDVSTTNLPATSSNSRLSRAADIDLDGDLDILACDLLFLNDGNARFSDATTSRLFKPRGGLHILLADLDGDGDPDIWRARSWYVTGHELLINHHRQIDTPVAPRLGQQFSLDFHVRPGYGQAAALAIPYVALAEARTPLPPFGTLGLDPKTALALPWVTVPPTGKLAMKFTVPQDQNLRGLRVSFQALMIDNVTPAHLSNVITDQIQ
ncbi:MAG: FG-GAP repeat domain-containing protein, partial [Planctomycetota bacterium]